MAFDTADEARVQAIERALNRLQTAIGNLAAKETLRKLLLVRQQEVTALTTRVAALEAQVSLLQQD